MRVSLGDGTTLAGIAPSAASGLLAPPTTTAEGADGAANAAAVRLLVELLAPREPASNGPVLLALDGLALPDAAVTSQFARLADQSAIVSIQPLSRLASYVDTSGAADVVTLPARAGRDLTPRVAAIDEVRGRAAGAATMLTDSPQPAQWSDALDSLLASGIDDTTFESRLAAVRRDVDGILGAVTAPDPSTLTITGSSSTLHLTLNNSADMPLTVALDVRSPKLTFPDGIETFTVPAASSSYADVPVRARSNGTFSIEVRCSRPTAPSSSTGRRC